MNSKNTLLVVLFSFFLTAIHAQSIRINELVSSNSTYFDEDGDTPDWIELYNFGVTPVSLLNWGLTDDLTDLHSWQFPDLTINPDEYILVWASDKDRTDLSFSRTLINQGDIHNYLVPNTEPDANWNNESFDDSSWQSGPSGFGFGDNDDATIIPTGTNSIYTRITFEIQNIPSLTNLILDIDYDDGFVAYINGVEIARSNMDGLPPSYDTNTNAAQEATMYNGDAPERFTIDTQNILLNEGDNVLAIQLHNYSNTSSDLTLIPFLSAIFSQNPTVGITPPEILNLTDANLHTNFKVSSNSEEIYLSDPNQTIIDQVLVENLPSDTSFGVSPTSGNLVNYIDTTPGAVNSNIEYAGAVASTITFSHNGGAVTAPINLVLSGNQTGQTIRYTTDATIPTENDLAYVSPIYIDANTVVRARIFETNHISSITQNKSFVFNSNHAIDVIFLTTEPDNFFNEDTGIYVSGPDGTYETNFPYFESNFWEDWERPIHFAYYENNNAIPVVEYNAGVKIFGGWSRGHDQKSLSLFARGQYGASEFEHSFFNELNYDKFQSLVLRNSGNDWLSSSIKDITLTSLMRDSGLDFQEHKSVATYINGEYWGMYNMREKNNEHMLASKHDIDADDITVLQNNADVVEGSNTEYLDLINYVTATDLSIDANFIYVTDRVDIENYALYQASNIFFNNQDWPGNNIKFWKHPNGKWRWILYDTDFGFGPPWNTANYSDNTLSFALEEYGPDWPNPAWSTLLFRSLTTNINFRNTFINRYADELNTRFLPDNVKIHIETIYQSVLSEIPAYYTRWNAYDNSLYFVNELKNFADARPNYAKDHIKSTFGLPEFHPITITNNDVSQGFVKVNNNLNIQESSWTGDYFETVPIELTAVAEIGYEFSHWSGDVNATEATINVSLVSAYNVIPNFTQTAIESIVINEINYKSSNDFDAGDWVELYNPNTTTIDISNWQLKDNNDTNIFNIPSQTLIQPNAYIVLVKEAADFSLVFPSITNFVGDIGFGFGSEDSVRLFNDQSILQDEVTYTSTWPICADGTGQTLELNSTELDNSLPQNWSCINPNGSPNNANTNTILSTEDILINTEVLLYPNPVTNVLYIKGIPNLDSIIVFDITGREILNKKVNNANTIDLSNLNSGVYLVHFKENNTLIASKKIIKI